MSPTLTALNGLVVLLAWQGQRDVTYTVQTSTDLLSWSTVPAVFNGLDNPLSIALDLASSPFFTRLRASAAGDTNQNGLPDQWEWSVFGRLDVDSSADPDLDGAANYVEWLAGTDPLDYFNGDHPTIHLACGDEWLVPTGQPSSQALVLSLTRRTGEPWADAPVKLRLESADARLLQEGDHPQEAVNEITAYTDSMGRIDSVSHAIHVLGASQPDHLDQLQILAGHTEAHLRIRTMGVLPGEPPRRIKWRALESGHTEFTWETAPGNADGFLIEKETVSGEWIQLARIESLELPQPDPVSGRFKLVLDQF